MHFILSDEEGPVAADNPRGGGAAAPWRHHRSAGLHETLPGALDRIFNLPKRFGGARNALSMAGGQVVMGNEYMPNMPR